MRGIGIVLLLALAGCLAAGGAWPAAAQTQTPPAVSPLLDQIRQAVLHVDEQQRAVLRVLSDPAASGDSVQQPIDEAGLRVLDGVNITAGVIRESAALSDDEALLRAIDNLALSADAYTLAAATLDQELSARTTTGASVPDLLASARADPDVADARSTVVAAFNELAARYGVEPLPASSP